MTDQFDKKILNVLSTTLSSFVETKPSNLAARIGALGRETGNWTESDTVRVLEIIQESATIKPEDLVISQPRDKDIKNIRKTLGFMFRSWDYLVNHEWTDATPIYSRARRDFVYELLGLADSLKNALNFFIPLVPEHRPSVISLVHQEWYTQERAKENSFYWDSFRQYLEDKKSFSQSNLRALDESSSAVVRNLSDPYSATSYSSRGLVVGHVQSGKTTNFTATIAKAVDAGYRFVIVLAGMTDVLREQTQRRLDKELIGRSFIQGNFYDNSRDINDFVDHRSERISGITCEWRPLTGFDKDYKPLGPGISALWSENERQLSPSVSGTLVDFSPVRLVVVKKQDDVLNDLIRDLKKAIETRPALKEIAAIIIDDESDQASLNTSKKKVDDIKSRTAINGRITNLLKILPRSQYIAYTATPFANVFIDPEDSEDLFPRDFIISLPEPSGYMGMQKFIDLPTESLANLESGSTTTGKYIRLVEGDDDKPENLKTALAMFALTGAIKLLREETDPHIHNFTHHTMLVHTHSTKKEHTKSFREITRIWDVLSPFNEQGRSFLKLVWTREFEEKKNLGSDDDYPEIGISFAQILPYIGKAYQKINEGSDMCYIVNSDKGGEAPNFDVEPCWKVLVGGNKLSRGYTVEGLTISYFRRQAKANDTMMQMGRWFGFRKGYEDLIRLYLGGPTKDKNALEPYRYFCSLCEQEEDFRKQVQLIVGGVYTDEGFRPAKPADVPPLVQSILRTTPTAKNKMYNTELVYPHLNDQWWMPLTYPKAVAKQKRVLAAVEDLLSKSTLLKTSCSLKVTKKSTEDVVSNTSKFYNVKFYHAMVELEVIRKILEASLVTPKDVLVTNFLNRDSHRSVLANWHIVIPLLERESDFSLSGVPLTTITREMKENHLGTLGGSAQRYLAEFLRERTETKFLVSLKEDPDKKVQHDQLSSLVNSQAGVFMLYQIKVKDNEDDFPIIGFEMLFPSGLPKTPYLKTRVKSKPDQAIVGIDEVNELEEDGK